MHNLKFFPAKSQFQLSSTSSWTGLASPLLWLGGHSYTSQTVCWSTKIISELLFFTENFLATIITSSSHFAANIHWTCLSPCLLSFQEYSFQVCLYLLGKAGRSTWRFQRPYLWNLTCGITNGCLGAWPCFLIKVPHWELITCLSPFSPDGVHPCSFGSWCWRESPLLAVDVKHWSLLSVD